MTQTPHNPNASFFYFCFALKYKITLSTLSLIPASARGWGGGKATFLLRKNVLSAPAKAHNESGQGCRAAWRERGETKKNLCTTLRRRRRRRRRWRRRKCSLAIKKCKSENKENRACKAKVQNLNSVDSDVDRGSGSDGDRDSVRNNVENFVVPSCGMPSPPHLLFSSRPLQLICKG